MSRVPDYMLREPFRLVVNGDYIDLPEGTFVRPIELQYVPKHVIEDERNRYFNPEISAYCYTRYGIIAIEKRVIRQV